MKYLKEYKYNDPFDEEDWDEMEPYFQHYIIFKHINRPYYILVAEYWSDGKVVLLEGDEDGKLLGFSFPNLQSSRLDLRKLASDFNLIYDYEIERIKNNEKIITAAVYVEYKFSLDEVEKFMEKEIPMPYVPIKYLTKSNIDMFL